MPVFAALVVSVLVLDQLSKILIRASLPLGAEIPVLPVFSITHVGNTGIAFGLFQQRNLFFIGLGVAVTVALFSYGKQLLERDRPSGLAMAAIIGGAIGNLVDRVLFGRVTDFLDFYIGVHHWPVFNIADSAICVSAGFIAIRSLVQWRSAQTHAGAGGS